MNLIEINKFILKIEEDIFTHVNGLKLSTVERNIIFDSLKNIENLDEAFLFKSYKKANRLIGDVNPNQSITVIRNWYLDGLLNQEKLNQIEVKNNFVKKTNYLFYKINEKAKLEKEIFNLIKKYIETKDIKIYNDLIEKSKKNPFYYNRILQEFTDINSLSLEQLSEIKSKAFNNIERMKGVVGMVENEQIYINGIIASDIEYNTMNKDGNNEKIANFRLQNKNDEGKTETYFVSVNEEDFDLLKDIKKYDLVQTGGYLEENNGYNNFFIKNLEKTELSKEKYPNLIEFNGNLAFDPILEEREGSLGKFKYVEISIYDEENKIFRSKAVNKVAIELAKHSKGDYVKVSGELSEYLGKDGKVYEEFKIRNVKDIRKKLELEDITITGNLAEKPIINTKEFDDKVFIYSNFAIYENLENDSKIWYCNAINEFTESLKSLDKGDLIEINGVIQKDEVNGREYENIKVKEAKLISKKKDKQLSDKPKEKGMTR